MAELRDDLSWEESRQRFDIWLLQNVGITGAMLKSLQETDDDWTFIIKIHALIEVALNHMILGHLRYPELSEIIGALGIQGRVSKLAFVEAFNLLPANGVKFIKLISKVRKTLVHDIKNFDFDLRKYLSELEKSQQNDWKVGLTFCLSSPVPQGFLDFSVLKPRFSIFESCMTILSQSFNVQPEEVAHIYAAAIRRAFEQHQKSTPKESL
jgi:hypothetical protein